MRTRSVAGIHLICVLLASCKSESAKTNPLPEPPKAPGAAVLLTNAHDENARFRSVGRFRGGEGAICTAFLVDNGGGDGAPAYVLTNAHCTHDLRASALVVNTEGRVASARMSFDLFTDTPVTDVGVKAVPFATMKGVDLAIVELDLTHAALREQHILPLPWANAVPSVVDASVTVVGAPLIVPSFVRQAACKDNGVTTIIERTWRWPGVRRLSCPDITNGNSGSPVIDSSGRVYAVLNTTTMGAPPTAPCSENAPCEVTSAAPVLARDMTYAMPITDLPKCFDPSGRFERSRQGCPLDPGRQLTVVDVPSDRERPTRADGTPNRWGFRLIPSVGPTHFRTKSGRAADVRCEDASGYSEPTPVESQDFSTRPLPREVGPHVVCILAGSENRWQERRFATPIVTFIDSSP